MLIYNFQKEFIGIDEEDLEVFGFANLSELKAESSDFADMFVRTPGYIHNFKHVHWIDFVTCADPSEQSKVIIEVNSKTYKANIEIDTLYLSDNPTSKAYIINLNNLRGLTLKENGEFSEDIARKKPPRIKPSVGHAFNISPEDEEALEKEEIPEIPGFKPFEDIATEKEVEVVEKIETVEETLEPIHQAPLEISFDDEPTIDEPVAPVAVAPETPKIDLDLSVDSLDLDDLGFEDEIVEPKVATAPVEEEDDGFDYSYNYDPQVASDELGLPIDLIEEFIQDFIAQAKEFKDELYSSLDEGDLDNVKILSHKLKGVAANLRIEDAFNTLSIINTSSDISEVGSYMNIFYKIIAKLSGEEIQTTKQAAPEVVTPEPVEAVEEDEDLFGDDMILDFKEDSKDSFEDEVAEPAIEAPKEEEDDLYLDIDLDLDIKDSEVPQKIEMPELADDDFLTETEDEEINIDDLLSVDEEIEEKIEFAIEEEPEEEVKVEEELEEEVVDFKYSKETVANEIGLDQESFDEIFEDYLQDGKSSATAIHEAVLADDFTKCKKEALKLKGMSDNMRVNTFKDELSSLINSSNKDELIKAVKKIDAIFAHISK